MRVEHITIAGMILTVVLSLGGSYGSYLVNAAEQTIQLETLTSESKENKKVNKITYKLEAEMRHNQRLDEKQQIEIDTAKKQVAEAEVNAARREANQINLTKSMDRLIISVEKLIDRVDEQNN